MAEISEAIAMIKKAESDAEQLILDSASTRPFFPFFMVASSFLIILYLLIF